MCSCIEEREGIEIFSQNAQVIKFSSLFYFLEENKRIKTGWGIIIEDLSKNNMSNSFEFKFCPWCGKRIR